MLFCTKQSYNSYNPDIKHLFSFLHSLYKKNLGYSATEGKSQTLVGAIPFCGEYPGPRFEDKFRSANQIDGISIVDGGKMADS